MKKIIVSILATFLMIFQMQAQQNVMVSQYMFNGLLLNPAYAGSHDYFSSTLMYRNQWVRVDGAPITSVLAVDGPLKNRNVGLGLIVMNDKIGATDQTDIYGNYSYGIKIKEGKLALGIKAGVSRYVYNTDKLVYWDATDNVYAAGNKQSSWLPKFGVGMYYNTKKWYAGLSIPVLFAYDPNYNFTLDVNKSSLDRRHYMATAGVVVPLNDYFKLEDYLKKNVSPEEYNAIMDRYLKILDSTSADIPDNLQQYWIDNQSRLVLKGKFLPDTSNLVKYKVEA